MNKEQFETATENTEEQRDVNIVQAQKGFILNATRRFIDVDTKAVGLAIQITAVAMTRDEAAGTALNFLETGAFGS